MACRVLTLLATVFLPVAKTIAADTAPATVARFFVQEYRVEGVHAVSPAEVEEAVYPFLGPERTPEDVELARLAVEALYRKKGYQAAFVQVPAQDASSGVVTIAVTEGVVGRTRVIGSRYSQPNRLKADAPSLTEGKVLDFNALSRDVARLNQVADRRVTPEFKPGAEAGTIDVDLKVDEAKPPLSANVELNNRNSANTSDLRLNGGVSYGNLLQRGHIAGLTFQLAPEDLDDAKVFSAYYLFRPQAVDFLTLQLLATRQESDVSTIGGSAVSGRGSTYGGRAIFALPGGDTTFFHTASAGLDFKHLDQTLSAGGSVSRAPVDYATLPLAYGATWLGKTGSTELSLSPTLGLRPLGADERDFATRRVASSGSFACLRADLSRDQKLPAGFSILLRAQAQFSSQALVDSEQFSAGGVDTVRGYHESEVAGDDAFAGSIEFRSPSFLPPSASSTAPKTEWRVHTFVEGARVYLHDTLPDQDSRFNLIGVGFGTRLLLRERFTGSIDAGWPLRDAGETEARDLRVNFSIGASY